MEFSIIIRNYNYGRFLSDCVDSALSQTSDLVEVIVVDDGSTDDSRQILKRYGDRVTVIEKTNGGECSAANAGLDAAKGDWVIFLDSDDVLAPNCVETVAQAVTKDCTRVHWHVALIDDGGALTGYILPPKPYPDLSFVESMKLYGAALSACQSSNAYRRDALIKAFPADTSMWKRSIDVLMNGCALAQGRTANLKTVLAGYRIHPCNLSEQNTREVASTKHSVLVHKNLETCLREFLGPQVSTMSFGYPRYHWYHRLASFRLAPESHPFPNDRRSILFLRTLRASSGPNRDTWFMRVVIFGGTVVLAYLPRPVLRALFPLFARVSRRLSLSRSGRAALSNLSPELRKGLHWRDAFDILSGVSGSSGTPERSFGDGTPSKESNVGATSSTLPFPRTSDVKPGAET